MRKWSPCVIGTKQQHSKVIIGNVDVTPVSVARNLGTCFDFNLNLREQFDKTCKYKFFHLYNMQLIRKYILSQESACTLVHAFIIGRIDFFNPLFTFVNCNACSCTAYNLTDVPLYSHITPVLCSLHWLPAKFRIDLKILPFTFKAIYGHSPGYLIDLFTIKEQWCYSLCSDQGQLKIF